MEYPMKYPKLPEFGRTWEVLNEFARYQYEVGAGRQDIQTLVDRAEQTVLELIETIKSLPADPEFALKEPDTLEGIRSLRPQGIRKLWKGFNSAKYVERLTGSLYGRFAGCTLGAPVECWSVEDMTEWAAFIGDPFPPVDYWSSIKNPNFKRYGVSECFRYTKSGMNGIPVDDDLTYTILGLLMMEDYGTGFTTDDVGAAWLKYLPHACSAERITLKNLKAGVSPSVSAVKDNPYTQWIGADIRSDPWGYLAPGLPEKAAELAYRDAYISHRRNGIYGEMYFSAVIAAAFETDNTVDALKIGLAEIPRECLLSQDVQWALEAGKGIRNHLEARKAVEERFGQMSGWHTNLNACLTIFGLMIGGDDVTKVIGEVVAMGYDNDCTAATAGSIVGAVRGISGIPAHWYQDFNNRILTYIIGHPEFAIDDLIKRFTVQAEAIHKIVG